MSSSTLFKTQPGATGETKGLLRQQQVWSELRNVFVQTVAPMMNNSDQSETSNKSVSLGA